MHEGSYPCGKCNVECRNNGDLSKHLAYKHGENNTDRFFYARRNDKDSKTKTKQFENSKQMTKDDKKREEQTYQEDIPHSQSEVLDEPAQYHCKGPCSALQKSFSNHVEYELHISGAQENKL